MQLPLRTPHWSTDIPLATPHYRMPSIAKHGWAQLPDMSPLIPEDEYLSLIYQDWRSGGDTTFAPIATADGSLDCRGFWKNGSEHPDRDGIWTENALRCPSIVAAVDNLGAEYGRVRVIRLQPQDEQEALRHIHRDDNNRFNPAQAGWVVRFWIELSDAVDGAMLLMEQGSDGLPDSATLQRIPLHKGARFIVDSQRLWHVVTHRGEQPRYALICSLTSSEKLDAKVRDQML